MLLEDIAKQYGMNDYLEVTTGKIYQLSKAFEGIPGTLVVPVEDNSTGTLLGYATMGKEAAKQHGC